MKENPAEQYLRIGTRYYKIVEIPLASADTIKKLIVWEKETIKFDHGDAVLRKVKCFDGFCLIYSKLNGMGIF